MTLPGEVVTQRDSAPPRTQPTSTGTWFITGLAEKGPTTPTKIRSLREFEQTFGGRVAYSTIYDCVDQYFRRGGQTLWFVRLLGPSPVKASLALQDGSSGTVVTLTAKHYGDAYNGASGGLSAAVNASGGNFTVTIYWNSVAVETSPTLADKAALLAWLADSDYVDYTSGASSTDPVTVAETDFASGADDRASITDTHRIAALDTIPKDKGPGSCSIPGATTTDAWIGILKHGRANDRRAILDWADGASASTIATNAATVRALGADADGPAVSRYGAPFGPWANVPGTAAGTTRAVPYSAIQAALEARRDAATGNPNIPAAGKEWGNPGADITARQTFTTTELETLNDAGVNVAREIDGEVLTYGYRTLADKDVHPLHWQYGNVRVDMAIAAKAAVIGRATTFGQIDGRGVKIAQYGSDIASMLLTDFYSVDALYGATPDDAFRVDVGSAVNTVESIAEGRIRAVISAKRAPMAERAEIEVVLTAITQEV